MSGSNSAALASLMRAESSSISLRPTRVRKPLRFDIAGIYPQDLVQAVQRLQGPAGTRVDPSQRHARLALLGTPAPKCAPQCGRASSKRDSRINRRARRAKRGKPVRLGGEDAQKKISAARSGSPRRKPYRLGFRVFCRHGAIRTHPSEILIGRCLRSYHRRFAAVINL